MSNAQRAPQPENEQQKAISAILERDAIGRARIAQVEAKRARAGRWGGAIAAMLAAAAIYLWIGDPPFLRKRREPEPPASKLQAGARFTLYLLGCRIEEYRRKHGAPPDDLSQLGSVPADVAYMRRGEGFYVLTYAGVNPPIRYDSEFGNLGQLAGASLHVVGSIAEEGKK